MNIGYGGGSALATLTTNVVANVLANSAAGASLPENVNQSSQTQRVINADNIAITGMGKEKAQSKQTAATLSSHDLSLSPICCVAQNSLQFKALRITGHRRR